MQRNTANVLKNSENFLLGCTSSQASIKPAKPEKSFICGHFNLSCCAKAENKYMLPKPVLEINNNQDFPDLSS